MFFGVFHFCDHILKKDDEPWEEEEEETNEEKDKKRQLFNVVSEVILLSKHLILFQTIIFNVFYCFCCYKYFFDF